MNEGKEQRLKSNFQSDGERRSIILPRIFSGYSEVLAGMSTKIGSTNRSKFPMNLSYKVGDDPKNVAESRKIFFSQLGVLEGELAHPIQCHSNTVLRIDSPGTYERCDALITNVKRLALVATVADCVPLFLFDPIHKAIGMVHAGWRGTVDEIAKCAIEKMRQEYQSESGQILAFIGPSAGVCCYEVGEEVAVMFKNKSVSYKEKRAFIDLKNENKLQLQQQGVVDSNIEVSPSCTICMQEVFHSFRRDGQKSGRMMATICVIA